MTGRPAGQELSAHGFALPAPAGQRKALRTNRLATTCVAAALVAGAAACSGSGAATSGATRPASPSESRSTAPASSAVADDVHSAGAAKSRAHAVIALERIPGATPVAKAPSPVLDRDVWATSSQNLVDVHRYVTVPGRLSTVMAWVKAHPPAGFALQSSSIGGSDHVWGYTFSSGTRGRTDLEVIGVQIGSQVGVRLDGQVIWVPTKTSAERIPTSVTRAILDYTGPTTTFGAPPNADTTPKPKHAMVTVTGSRLTALVDDLNGLTVGTPFTELSCPVGDGEHADIRMSYGGHRVVYSMDFVGCPAVDVTSDGHPQPYLDPDPQLVKDIYAAVGVVETPIPRAPDPGPPVRTKPPAITVFEHSRVAAQRVGDASRDLAPAGDSRLTQNSSTPSHPPYSGAGTAVDRSMTWTVSGTTDQLVAWYRAHPAKGTVAAEPFPTADGVRRLVMEPINRNAPVKALVWVSMLQRGDVVVYRIDAQTAWK